MQKIKSIFKSPSKFLSAYMKLHLVLSVIFLMIHYYAVLLEPAPLEIAGIYLFYFAFGALGVLVCKGGVTMATASSRFELQLLLKQSEEIVLKKVFRKKLVF